MPAPDSNRRMQVNGSTLTLISAVALLSFGACAEESATTGPEERRPDVAAAALVLDGLTITARVHIVPGNRMRVEAQLGPGDASTIARVQVDYRGPGMMGSSRRPMVLYDDGTHGDRAPGDGWYCYENEFYTMMYEIWQVNQDRCRGSHQFQVYCVYHDGHRGRYFPLQLSVD